MDISRVALMKTELPVFVKNFSWVLEYAHKARGP
jgi:hypothetical protein